MEIMLAEPKDFKTINQLFEAAKRQMIQDNTHQ